MTVTDVKGATSGAVGSEDEGSVFDVTIEEFTLLRNRAENFIIEAVKNNLPVTFKQYLSKPEWTTVGEPDMAILAVTPELDQPLQVCFLLCHTKTLSITRSRTLLTG